MLINDTNRLALAKYLTNYVEYELDFTQHRLVNAMEQGLEAYESINQPKQYAIAPGLLRLNLNGQQFLLSDNKKVKLFDSIAEAREWAKAVGMSCCDVYEYLPESKDYVAVEQNDAE